MHGEGGVGGVLLVGLQARAVFPDEEVVEAVAGLLHGYVVWEDIEHGLDHIQGLVWLGLERQKRRAKARGVRAVHWGWVRKQRLTMKKRHNQKQKKKKKK